MTAVQTVRSFRQTLLWPLLLQRNGEPWTDVNEIVDHMQQDSSPWRRADDLISIDELSPCSDKNDAKGAREARERVYSAFVYFHPFVQEFLRPSDPETAPAVRLDRADLRSLDVQLTDRPDPGDGQLAAPTKCVVSLEVPRVSAYIFETGVVVFTFEIAHKTDLPLDVVEDLQDCLRRVYAPYWANWTASPGHCPVAAQWNRVEVGSDLVGMTDRDFQALVEKTLSSGHPGVSAIWDTLTFPLKIRQDLRHLKDERAIGMSHIAVDDPFRLTRGDIVRLGLFDDAGPSSTLPYSTTQLADFEEEHCYDRFWNDDGRAAHSWMNTRYVCSGFSFAAIGSHRSTDFMDGQNSILRDFRYHYFLIGLIVTFHRASLLVFESRMASLASRLRITDCDEDCTGDAHQLLRDLLAFTHRFGFIEVTNHVQGQELFALWKRHLGVERLQRHLRDEAAQIEGILRQQRIERVLASLERVGQEQTSLAKLLNESSNRTLETVKELKSATEDVRSATEDVKLATNDLHATVEQEKKSLDAVKSITREQLKITKGARWLSWAVILSMAFQAWVFFRGTSIGTSWLNDVGGNWRVVVEVILFFGLSGLFWVALKTIDSLIDDDRDNSKRSSR